MYTTINRPVGGGQFVEKKQVGPRLTDMKAANEIVRITISIIDKSRCPFCLYKDAGRDHWGRVYSTVLAGGVRGGQVVGRSDAQGGVPADNPVHVSDFVATIYHALGYGAETHVTDRFGRPHLIVQGKPVRELF